MSMGRRLLTNIPQLTRRAWEDVAPELERFLKRLWESEGSGVPAGFGNATPPPIVPGSPGGPGAGNTSGWAAADHVHPVVTGVPSGLNNSNDAGTSSAIPRLDHKHKRDTRVQKAGADVGTRNALNFADSSDIVLTPVDGGSGPDKVTVTATMTVTRNTFSRGGVIVQDSGISVAKNVIVWDAPFNCEVLEVKGYRVGGTGATVNARKNGASTHLAANLSLTSSGTWLDGGAVQNVSYTVGDRMEIMLVTVAGLPSQVAVQLNLRRT